jgi:Arc/MetJ-type ribon-helix-helix transcriptional regulator
MTTLSIPVPPKLEELIKSLIKKGYAPTKAEVVRKALDLLAEEEAVTSVLKAEQEVKDGKLFTGNLKVVAKKFS